MVRIYTIGYGTTGEVKFIDRLQRLPLGTIVVDVRREGSKSRNGKWCYQGVGMWKTVEQAAGYIYHALPELANTGKLKDYVVRDEDVRLLAWSVKQNPICLLCAERKAFKEVERQGVVYAEPNCHRVLIADELARRLDCEVVHL